MSVLSSAAIDQCIERQSKPTGTKLFVLYESIDEMIMYTDSTHAT